MKKYLVALWLIFLASSVYGQTFLSQISLAQIDSALTAAGEWHPFPTIENRAAYENIPSQIAEQILTEAEEVKDYDWPVLTATLYLDYARTGTRTNYRKIYKRRRENLCKLVLAECIRNDGKYLDQIANGIWAICEETTWIVPAHVAYFHDPIGLPNTEERHVDLFAAETGATLSMIKYLLGEKLDSVSPLIRKRIQKEVKERILEPNLRHTDFRWMGYDKTIRRPNNWNPWICSNWLQCILLSDDVTSYKAKQIYKLTEVLNNFVEPYPEDGGCDEGASYWRRAAGSLFDAIDLLYSATAGRMNFYHQPLIKNMAQYLYRMWIDENYFVNFADCNPELIPEPTLLYRFGKKIEDPNLVTFAAYFAKAKKFSLTYPEMLRCLNEIFLYEAIRKADGKLPYIRDSFFPRIQVMTARSVAGSPRGFFIAAKGGTNGESHNHNDVGQFILYYNGKPVIVDAGKDTYKRITFSNKRYTLWHTQSGAHNLPIINGKMQQNGTKFKAENVCYQANDEKVTFSLDIAKAYPAAANVIKWRRTIDFFRKRKVIVTEDHILKGQTGDIELHFLTPCSVKEISTGKVVFIRREGFSILLKYDPEKFAFATQKIHFDKKDNTDLWESWGDSLTMVRLKGKNLPSIGKLQFEFSVYQE